MTLQLFTGENRQMREKDQEERDRREKEKVRTRERRDRECNPWQQKYSCQFPVADRQQC